MPQNPLLPNKKLQQLYALMVRAREGAERGHSGLEAIVAAAALLLEPGDAVVSGRYGNLFAALLGPARRNETAARSLPAFGSPLAFASGAAAGAQVAGNSGLVAVLLDAGPDANWPTLLEEAQSHRLPLIVICLDTPKKPSGAATEALTWTSLNRFGKKFRYPVLTVDGADGVAMVRALQESVLRARQGDGPALLWCLMPPAGGRARSSQENSPVDRLERYMTARRIALPPPAKALGRASRLSQAKPML